MQVILTEEEYLRLKNQFQEDKDKLVKRIDVILAIRDLENELRKYINPSNWGPFQIGDETWMRLFKKCIASIEQLEL